MNPMMVDSITSSGSTSEMDEAVKKTPRAAPTTENGIDHGPQSLIQRLQPNEQGRRVRLYRNGDRFFKGVWYTVIPSLRSWSAFLEDLQKIHFLIDSLALPHGVRFIFHSTGEPCNGLEEIRHGQSYVVCSTDKFKRIDYANAAQPMWSFVSNKLSEPPKSGLRETFQREPNGFVKPRIITIIRNGIKPRRVVRHLLNKRTAQSYDMVISDITAIIKLNSGAVRKLYSISGKQVNTLADFFVDDYIFIAYGTERICCDDFYVISEEYKRIEISKKRPMNRPNGGQFRLRPTQMKMLTKRNQDSFRKEPTPMPPNGNGAEVELPPELKDKVKLMEVLGDGNTALVYKAAFREEDGQWSMDALKIIQRDTLKNEEVLAFVRTEIELMSTLRHRQIVLLRNCQIFEGNWYIRMELVPDGDMFECLRRRRTFNQTETASCVECICNALHYLHTEKLIVHRDVKLENLLVYTCPDEGRLMIKLADFGLACRLQDPEQLLYQLCGTPTYVAPEGQGKCDETVEFEAEEQLAMAMADMEMDEEPNDNDFDMSESSAEFYFSRRASMDELSEPGTSAATHQQLLQMGSPELRLPEESREYAQKDIKIEIPQQQNGPSTPKGNNNNNNVMTMSTEMGKETPKARRKQGGRGQQTAPNSARGEHRNGLR